MNILFVLYYDFTANSAGHVFSLANELSARHDCAVAVPKRKDTVAVLGSPKFRIVEYEEAQARGVTFRDGRGPDIVHAWTPREVVRTFCAYLKGRYQFRQFVHLEDNEWHITARALAVEQEDIQGTADDMDLLVPDHLSHPIRSREFLAASDGVSLIIDRLGEFVPDGVRSKVVWVSADQDKFFPRPIDFPRRRSLGILDHETVLVYTGNVHPANAKEVRSLYLAVAILNREGTPARIIRAGTDVFPFLGEDDTWARQHAVELGYVPHKEVAGILAMADFLVQPGRPDLFNDYRLPSKLPEFFAMGRPVMLPATNLGLHVRHREQAWVEPVVDGLAIVKAVLELRRDPQLRDQLSAGARRFFEENLNWSRAASILEELYTGR